eukprot:TRINITY_DN13013_c0_g1::TRINITY_DN13013_c0_g1_i1::g.11121::m.11121 TRINITY_DN13013_c0_g1::TRINITY_DN13013_c0_g1_i1::g.11121  ORF type:complete len:174 (-),score=26.56,sp/Q9UU77/YQMA_SCHPO/50.50/4e-27,Ank_4/PF13637.1/1.1e-08,Ank_4/PF13637.1/2.1e-10,Ank_4/PF13637.1/0.039,Ank_2/PF12796.2/1.1e-14,Ank_2/PF12796.2/0.016,Ank/PF00023.25/1.1,Ank/PF00023.25/2.1e-09,Ank/PF00023.25/0.054,Ank_5/PF13857.1/17,Ank_5/PF13857.1/1.6e-12,Ank_5/PF13857.1/0.21,Ank_3/PF13606.1/0.45,Ank_3/PF13606.1/1.2e-07,Ank_3/PF13606
MGVEHQDEDSNIWVAASDGDMNAVKKYLENGISVDAKDPNGYTPVHAAASYAHTDLLKYLISLGANVNIQDEEGDTPLHFCEDGESTKILLEHGADPSIRNSDDKTAADVAIEDDREEVAIALGAGERYRMYLATLQQMHDQMEIVPDGEGGVNIRFTLNAMEGDVDLQEGSE